MVAVDRAGVAVPVAKCARCPAGRPMRVRLMASTKLGSLDFQPTGALVAPWLKHPGIARDHPSWESGEHAEYLKKWLAWFRSIPVEARTPYSRIFKEPAGWEGFYADAAAA